MNQRMMNKNGIIGIAFACIVLAGLASAFPFTATIDGPSSVSLMEGTSLTVPLVLHNVDFEKHSITITTDTDSGFIEAVPIIKKFSLNGYESTTLGIVIRATDDADHDTYEVMVEVDVDGQLVEVPITVYVGSNPFLTVGSFTKTVCGNEWVDAISFSVKNNSSEDTVVHITAEHPVLFPTFEEESLSLENGETEIIELELNVSPQNTGEYEGMIFVENEHILVSRPFSVKVQDCPDPVEKVLSLTLPKKPKDLVKLETSYFPITLKNLTSQTQEVEIAIESAIPVDSLTVHLSSKETLTLDIILRPDLSVPAGTHPVKITATASGYSVSQTVTMKVLPLAYIEAEAVNTIYELEEGETQTMQVIVKNVGDTSQSIGMAMQFSTPGIDYTFTPSALTLPAGKTHVFMLSVHAAENAGIDRVNNAILIQGNPARSIPLSFVLIDTDAMGVLSINVLSAPQVIHLNAGESKEFEIVVENPTDESILGIRFKLVGVNGSGLVLIPGDPTEALAPHQTKTMRFTLMASDDTRGGTYDPILVMESADAAQTVPFTVIVDADGNEGVLTGLFTFAGKNAGLIGLIILVLAATYWLVGKVMKRSPVWASPWVR